MTSRRHGHGAGPDRGGTRRGAAAGWVRVVRVRGDLDQPAVDALRREVADLAARDPATDAVVDLTGVGYIDSTGLGVLVRARSQLVAGGGSLALVVDDANVLRILRVSSLARLFAVHRTLDEALPPVPPTPLRRP